MTLRASLKADKSPEAALLLDEEISDDEPSKEEILASIRRGMEDVKAGRTRPARQALEEIRRKLEDDADSC